jgi:hypothetical protein
MAIAFELRSIRLSKQGPDAAPQMVRKPRVPDLHHAALRHKIGGHLRHIKGAFSSKPPVIPPPAVSLKTQTGKAVVSFLARPALETAKASATRVGHCSPAIYDLYFAQRLTGRYARRFAAGTSLQ